MNFLANAKGRKQIFICQKQIYTKPALVARVFLNNGLVKFNRYTLIYTQILFLAGPAVNACLNGILSALDPF